MRQNNTIMMGSAENPSVPKPEFIVSYRGEVEYAISGRKYNVRYWGYNDGHYNKGVTNGIPWDVWTDHIEPSIGTVRNDSYDRQGNWLPESFFEFPPAEIVALFPGMVGARYIKPSGYVHGDGQKWVTEYATPRSPLVVDDDTGGKYITTEAAAAARKKSEQ